VGGADLKGNSIFAQRRLRGTKKQRRTNPIITTIISCLGASDAKVKKCVVIPHDELWVGGWSHHPPGRGLLARGWH